jgi:hypothetical protein
MRRHGGRLSPVKKLVPYFDQFIPIFSVDVSLKVNTSQVRVALREQLGCQLCIAGPPG